MNILPALFIDAYKAFHHQAYHPAVTHVYSNFTNRFGKYSNTDMDEVVFFGLQYFLINLHEKWNKNFFEKDEDFVVSEYERVISSMLGTKADGEHIRKLHKLGYLPLQVKALPEGSLVPYGIPCVTITNTNPDFYWLPNLLETTLSANLWPMSTSATTAFAFRKRFEAEPSLDKGFIPFMAHDFSYRGMMGDEAALMSGLGHLTSFVGSDTVPAALAAEKYYGADMTKELVFASVNATEHSVMCSYGQEGELASLKHLLLNVAPEGILSVVSDTWDFWKLVTEYLPELKDIILERNGTLVIRPDSGDPVKILTGYKSHEYVDMGEGELYETQCIGYDYYPNYSKPITQAEQKGLIECLWDIFEGTITDSGMKQLDSHLGAIYGDSITLERQDEIIRRLVAKGFVPSVVLGVGSYTYQHVTRDTHGSAMKATCVQKGEGNYEPIFKQPKTDSKKNSAKGLMCVIKKEDGTFSLSEDVTPEVEASELNKLKTVYLDGMITSTCTLSEIRSRINENFK